MCLEFLEKPAEIPGAETEVADDFRRRQRVRMRQLVKHPGFGQGERALEQAFQQTIWRV